MTRVLVLDDDPDVLDAMTMMLAGRYSVESTLAAEEALERVSAGSVDVLVTDLAMPGMDGLRFIREARKRQPGIGVIVVSAYVDGQDPMIRSLMHHYTDSVLTKPVRRQEILDAIDRLEHRPVSPPPEQSASAGM